MEQIEQRKEKAAELSSGRHANTDYAPKLTPYERKKQCSLCNVLVRHYSGGNTSNIIVPFLQGSAQMVVVATVQFLR